MRRCLRCGNGHEVSADAKFCPECGAAVTRPQVDEPTRQRATPPVTPVAPAKGKKPWAIIVGFLVLVLIIVVSAAALLATGETEAWQAAGK